MRDAVRRWLRETHGPGFELLRHFTGSFFDSELTSLPGEWSKVAAGIVAYGSLVLEMPAHAAGLHALEGVLQWTLCGFVVGRSLDRGRWRYLWLRVISTTAIIALAVDGAASLLLGFEWLQYFRPLLIAIGWGAALLLYAPGNPIRPLAPAAPEKPTLGARGNRDGAAS